MSRRDRPRSQRSGSPYCTRRASPEGVQPTAVSFGLRSSFLSSSVSTRSRAPSATDATYQPFLLVISNLDPSRENETTENDSASSSPPAGGGPEGSRLGLGVIDRGLSSSIRCTKI